MNRTKSQRVAVQTSPRLIQQNHEGLIALLVLAKSREK